MSDVPAYPYEVRDPESVVPQRREWIRIFVWNMREAAQAFLNHHKYLAAHHPNGLVLECRHPFTSDEIYDIRVTVPRPVFKVHLQTRKAKS